MEARTAIENAVEFGRHDKYAGWALGLLVACSVQPDMGTGRSGPIGPLGKISANEFARRSGTGRARVIRYLEAWEKAAKQRIVPPASKLGPDDVDAYDLPEGHAWSDYYDGGTASVGSGVGIIERHGAKAAVAAMTHETRRELVRELVRTPQIRAVAHDAIQKIHQQQPVSRPASPTNGDDAFIRCAEDMTRAEQALIRLVENINAGRKNGYLTPAVLREFVSKLRLYADAIDDIAGSRGLTDEALAEWIGAE